MCVIYASANVYLGYVAVTTLPDITGVPRGYAHAGPIHRLVVAAAHSGAFCALVLPGLAWLAGAFTLWRSHGGVQAAALSAVLTIVAFIVSFYIAGAMWGS